MQDGTGVSLIPNRVGPMSFGAIRLCTRTTESVLQSPGAATTEALEPLPSNKRSHRRKKPAHHNSLVKSSPHSQGLEKIPSFTKTQHDQE